MDCTIVELLLHICNFVLKRLDREKPAKYYKHSDKKFQNNFTMALCSFGGVNDQYGDASWALHETGMTPWLCCDNDMAAWLKDKFKGSGASGARGRPGDTKATSTGNSKYQKELIYAHKCSKWLFNITM